MLGCKLTLVKENSFTRRAQQSHLDNRMGGGWVGVVGCRGNSQMANEVCAHAKIIAAKETCYSDVYRK